MLHALLPTPARRLLSLLLCLSVGLLGCPPRRPALPPSAGVPDYQSIGVVRVPGGRVNVMGGNLLLARTDLSIDTRLGTREIGAVYNGTDVRWLFDFEVRYDGVSFLDPTGALYDVSGVAFGSPIPGSSWVVVDGDTLKTKGGLVHEFDVGGRLASLRWSSSSYPRLDYLASFLAGAWRTTTIEQCSAPGVCSDVFAIGYDGAGRVVSIRDRAGRLASFDYDSGGHLVAARDGLDTASGAPGFRYEYQDERLSVLTNAEGERIEYAYDGGGRLRSVLQVGEGDPVHHLGYGQPSPGLYVTEVRDPLGQRTRYRYDGTRRLLEIERPETGELTLRAWSGLRPSRLTEPHGAVTSFVWQDDDLVTLLEPGGNVVTTLYESEAVDREAPFERPVRLRSDLAGVLEERGYDAAGRLVSVTNGAGESTTYGYGEHELVETIAGPDGVVRICENHGDHGHPLRLRLGELVEDRVFDAVGNLLEGSDEFAPRPGGLLARAWDADRNLAGFQLADTDFLGIAQQQAWVTRVFRSDGRLLRIERPGGGDHEFVYDALGRLVERRERTDGAWHATAFAYDPAGRLIAREQPNGMREELDYDAAGRVVARRALRDGTLEGSVAFEYAAGLLVAVDDSLRGGVEAYGYDAAGRVVAVDFPEAERLTLGYDARSRRAHEELRIGASLVRRLDYGYDGADREVEIVDEGEPVVARSFANGRLAETRTGNGLVRSYQYDTLGMLAGSTTVDASGGIVEETTITRTLSGLLEHLETAAQTTTSVGVVATTLEEYFMAPSPEDPGAFAHAGKRVFSWAGDTGEARYLAYDVLGNATVLSDSTFVYNAEGNRLLSASPPGMPTIDYGYDAAGFVTSRAGVPLGWTATGRLASYGSGIRLEWDMLGAPISATVDGEVRRWRFGGRVVADASGAPSRIDLGEVRIDLASGTRLYRHLDFRQNVKFTTDDGGAVVSHVRYHAYGVHEVLGSDEDAARFVGRPELGDLAVLGARIYDPAIGRFLSQDPLLDPVNQYAYTPGNPVWFVDRDGLQSGLAGAIEDAASGAAFVAGAGAAIGTGTVAAPILLGLSLGIGGLAVALMVARRLSQLRDASEPGLTGCSPAALVSVPRPGSLLQALLLLQLILAVVLLRRREGRG